VERLRGGGLEFVEHGALGIVRLDCLRNALDRPVGQAGGLPAAEVGFDASAAGRAPSVATPSVAATIAARRDHGIGVAIAERVSAKYALVDVVVGVGPERVIRVGIEGVIDEVVVGVRPEQWAYPPDHDRVRKMASPLRIEEPALEGRARDRAHAWVAGGSPVGKGLVAQHAAREGAWVAGRTGAGSRRWNGAARLILLHHTQLRRHVLLWRGVAAAAPGRCRSGSAARPGLRQILLLARLRNSRATAAAPSADLRLLLSGSRRGRWRRRVPRHRRCGWAAGRTGRLLRRSAGRLRRARPASLR